MRIRSRKPVTTLRLLHSKLELVRKKDEEDEENNTYLHTNTLAPIQSSDWWRVFTQLVCVCVCVSMRNFEWRIMRKIGEARTKIGEVIYSCINCGLFPSVDGPLKCSVASGVVALRNQFLFCFLRFFGTFVV